MLTVYALRLKGDKEVRYIGQTQDVRRRVELHLSRAEQMPWATAFANWLKINRHSIEVVALAGAETRAEARRIERQMVTAFIALEHRLFNQWLVPAGTRCAPRETEAA